MIRVGVIGGGAAGMAAAISAVRNGAQVTLFEHTAKLGKKILSTGNGRCNLTNEHLTKDCFHGTHPEFAMDVLRNFGRDETLAFFEEIGIPSVMLGEGYYYPRSLQAASVSKALVREIERLGVRVICEATNLGVKKKNNGFLIESEKGKYSFDRIILACGGQAAPQTGSDGSGYALALRLGLKIVSVVPALVPLTSSDKGFKDISGIRVAGKITLVSGGKTIASASGELQLCDYGLSGIPVFQVSAAAARLLNEQKNIRLEAKLNFAEGFTSSELAQYVDRQIKLRGDVRCGDFLGGFLPEKLCLFLFKRMGVSYDLPAEKLSNNQKKELVNLITSFSVPITGTLGFDRAQVCSGGVDTSQVDPATMEVKTVPGLYVAGELLDIDGICGGYNLQFAWSTGALAGRAGARVRN